MATWFGDGLPSLSNLKGQITNFTKEVLSEGIVEEIGINFFKFSIKFQRNRKLFQLCRLG